MKRANTNKLSIKTETVRALSPDELSNINGGASLLAVESARCNVGTANAATSGSITSMSYINSQYVYISG